MTRRALPIAPFMMFARQESRMKESLQQPALTAPRSIGVRCPEFERGAAIPPEFSGFGDDVSPPLELTGVPKGVQSLAIVVDDPDAPGGTFTHWTVWNVRPTQRFETGVDIRTLGGVEGANDFGSAGYRGPLPPEGTHRYRYRVFAVDKLLGVPPNAPPPDVWRALSGHVIAWGELTGTFTRYENGALVEGATPGGRYGSAPEDAPHMEPEIAPVGMRAATVNVPEAIPGALPENMGRRLGNAGVDLA